MDDFYDLDGVKNIIPVASAKGGVGKSTTAINIATALNQLNHNIGILDADIYGPSIPKMLGINEKPKISEDKRFIPIEKFNMKCMSIGFLVDQKTPLIWRGPMIIKALKQMLHGVVWAGVDTLLIDLPPGTGDVQLTLSQKVNISGVVIVSTPQELALIDAIKGINMFKRVNVPVLGIVENMSYFICDSCNKRHEIFSYGGAKKESEKFKTMFLGEIPINKTLRIQSDEGKPACIDTPDGEIANIYLSIAQKIHEKIN